MEVDKNLQEGDCRNEAMEVGSREGSEMRIVCHATYASFGQNAARIEQERSW